MHNNTLPDFLAKSEPLLDTLYCFKLTKNYDGLYYTVNQVAYQGVPEKAYEVFVNSLHSCYLKQSLVIPDLEDHNPAGIIIVHICTMYT